MIDFKINSIYSVNNTIFALYTLIFMDKVIIFSAPSGSGKSTIVEHLLSKFSNLEFSISATSRQPRGKEENGNEYYFYNSDQFKKLIKDGAFIEYEEVYEGLYYGTLKKEIERIWNKGNIIIFDIDVAGGVNLKKIFGKNALSVFVKPPSIEELKKRLISRNTDSLEEIEKRLSKASTELEYEDKFDYVLINDDLEKAKTKIEKKIKEFSKK